MTDVAAAGPRLTSAAVLTDIDPTTGAVLATIPSASAEEVAAAVVAARRALPSWSGLGVPGRAAVLERVARRLEDPALVERLAGLVMSEMGKPLASARKEALNLAPGIRRLVAAASAALAPVEAREGSTRTTTSREPLGVVAAITPWNFPLGMAREVLVPALMAGNTVVFKPSPLVPLTGAALAEAFTAELPSDALVLVQGGDETGKALVAAEVDMVGFVGSVEAGRHIMAACAGGLKRLVLELGGKDPMIVCADADLAAAATYAVRESMRNSGQVCCAVERIYVEAPAAARLTELVVSAARALTVGDPRDEVFMGPLASAEQRSHVLAQLDDARRRGAQVLLGGRALPGPGFFVEPTVVTGVDDSMELSRRETFGPVAAIRVVQSAEEAVALANASPYGLGASVWTADTARGRALAARLESGQVGVNRGLGGAGDPPWCGVKQSGFGFLGSPDGYRQFSRPLSVSWDEPE
ncbi:MAG TPA: aldehyde dehydrogenase family protein [Planctomycetota bacterium]|nr:aldehyde dehydrogenase family protein [Planctomycetota bacterium]